MGISTLKIVKKLALEFTRSNRNMATCHIKENLEYVRAQMVAATEKRAGEARNIFVLCRLLKCEAFESLFSSRLQNTNLQD